MTEQRTTEQRTAEQRTAEQSRLEINWVNSLGGALAAVSSAVVLSTLGTAGTLIGAAMGSLVITVGGAVYAHSLRVARARLAASRTVLVRTRGGGLAEVADAAAASDGDDSPAGADATGAGRLDRWRQVLRELPWKRILVVSAAVFAVAMAAILAFELATGRPVSSYTGGTDSDSGTSVPGLGGGDSDAEPGGEQDPVQEEPGEEVPDEEPTTAPAEPTPTEAEPVEPAPTEAPVPPEETAP